MFNLNITSFFFLKSGAYSDLTIACGSDTYKVHKVIICGRADFFARTLNFGGKESESGVVDLPEDEPTIVKLLIQYLYEGEYEPLLPDGEASLAPSSTKARTQTSRPKHDLDGLPYNYSFPHTCHGLDGDCEFPRVCPHHTCNGNGNFTPIRHYASPGHRGSQKRKANCGYACQSFNCEECNPPSHPLPSLNGNADQLLHAKMYEIADKYDVVGLKDLVIEKFRRACHHFWNTDEFSVAAHHVFSTTPDHDKGLRDIVSAAISAHMSLIKKPEVKVLLAEFNGLALGILEEKVKENGW
ncbi:hypothetical protein AA0113_g3234 [Alternaria arborescens]|uniref:BTB domain-containing protein n=2 Tax=Alternaria arborescens TaxID=156630 RepID=A0A4Q4SJN5_9PLEO|nr:hypothetical protein AA0113_g3234 [Alternaria arborescens]